MQTKTVHIPKRPKVVTVAVTTAGAISMILVWVLNTFFIDAPEQKITAEIGQAVTVVFSGLIAWFREHSAQLDSSL